MAGFCCQFTPMIHSGPRGQKRSWNELAPRIFRLQAKPAPTALTGSLIGKSPRNSASTHPRLVAGIHQNALAITSRTHDNRRISMADDTQKNQGQNQGQNPGQQSGQQQKNPQDSSRKDPSKDRNAEQDDKQKQQDQGGQRRAS